MMKVKYIPTNNISYNGLTPGKVYDVIEYVKGDNICFEEVFIYNDSGNERCFYVYSSDSKDVLLKDVTSEYRNDVIDGILL